MATTELENRLPWSNQGSVYLDSVAGDNSLPNLSNSPVYERLRSNGADGRTGTWLVLHRPNNRIRLPYRRWGAVFYELRRSLAHLD